MSDPTPRALTGGLLRSGSVVSAMTLISRVLGFVRDQVIAIAFGAGATTDVFLVAFKIPNFLRRLFAEGAFAQAFIPVFTEYRETRDRQALRDLAAHVSGTLGCVLLLVSALGMLAAPGLVFLFAPGFVDSPWQFGLATDMLRITFPFLFFVSLTAYVGSILNTFGRFALPALAPVLLNLCMITAALLFTRYFEPPIKALAWGVFAAGIAQLAFLAPSLARLGLLPRPRWGWNYPGVRRILNLMAPALLGSSVAQINLLLDTVIASFLAAGSLSWLYYSDRLMEFPLGMLGVALGTVVLPRLSQQHAARSPDAFRSTIDWALRLTLIIGLPCAIGLLALAGPILSTLFEYGAFTASDTRMASYSLMAYSLGLPAFILIKLFAPAFFARQDTRTPVRIGIIALITNMVYNLVLVLPMVWLEMTAPHTALALATSMSAWQQAWMLYARLREQAIYTVPLSVRRLAWQVLVPLLLMGGVLWWLALRVDWHALGAADRVLALTGTMAAGMASYALTLSLAGVRPRHLAS